MKVVYYSYAFFADCDFPLVKELQDKGIDVHYYMPLYRGFQRSSILEFKNPIKKLGLVKASSIEDMQKYKECIDLERLYFIKGFRGWFFWIPSWILWVYTLIHIKKQKADIVHIDWQFGSHFEKFIMKFALGKKKVMTVHDPIMHSGQENAISEEKKRITSFKWADYYILLNTVQTDDFTRKYSIQKERIFFSKLPNYDSISQIRSVPSSINGDYCMFFGAILPYKGLEYLLEAMVKVHQIHPNLKLVVAGGGRFYFDVSKYEQLDYIIWHHRYIGVGELSGLLKKAAFVVCPYKDATQSGVIQTSFAMNVPVVATNVGALALDIKDGINGRLVPPCDSNALADSIISLYDDRELLQLMRNNIACEVGNCNGKIANDYIKIYKSIMCAGV